MPRPSAVQTKTKPAPIAATNFPVIKDRAAVAAVEEYAAASAEKGRLEARMKELKPAIEAALGGAPTAYAGNRVVTVTEVPELPGTPNRTITRDMIGQVIPGERGRRAYTMLKVQ